MLIGKLPPPGLAQQLNSSSEAALVVEVVGPLSEAVWSCFVLNKLFFWEEKSLKVWMQA